MLRKNRFPSNYRLYPFVNSPPGWYLCLCLHYKDYNQRLGLGQETLRVSKGFIDQGEPFARGSDLIVSFSSVIIKEETTSLALLLMTKETSRRSVLPGSHQKVTWKGDVDPNMERSFENTEECRSGNQKGGGRKWKVWFGGGSNQKSTKEIIILGRTEGEG